MRREYRRTAHQTDLSVESEGLGRKKGLISALLEMGMSEATSLQRLPAARDASNVVVSCFQHDRPLNKPAASPSIGSCPGHFPSESHVHCVES